MICIIGVGLYLSIRTNFLQIRKFPYAIRVTIGRMLRKREASDGSLTPFQAVCTALAATVGTGNIAGVAGAIAIGGPGAVFWMWISALLGMCTKFSEVTLAVHFRETNANGDLVGGPMYYIKNGLKKHWHWLAYLFSAFGVLTVFGTGNATQVNTITTAIDSALINYNVIAADNTSTVNLVMGIILAILVAMILLGGIKRIGQVTEKLVPFMALFYIILAVGVVIINWKNVPGVFQRYHQRGDLIRSSVTGGVVGSFFMSMKKVFPEVFFPIEAGLGTGSIAHACADTRKPVKQGMFGIFEVFTDTIVICTLTGFVVVMAHCWTGADAESWQALDKLPKYTESIAVLTPGTAMNGIVTFLVTLCFCLFAFTCLLGMISFSEIAANRIRKDKICINFVRCIGLFVAAFGILCNIAGLELGNLWAFSDLGNILIVFFNVPIVYVGAKYVFRATRHYKKNDGTPFTSEVIGRNDCAYWDEQAKKAVKNFSGK